MTYQLRPSRKLLVLKGEERSMTALDGSVSASRNSPRALITFCVLGFGLSWYPWLLHLLGRPGNGGPNPLGLLLAALIAGYVDARWRGTTEVLRSIVRVRAPILNWAVALLLPLTSLAFALAIGASVGVAITPRPVPWSDLLDKFIIMFAFVGLGEEPAWRGFLLPLLQRTVEPLAATLIVAAIWAVWHLPLLGTEFAWPLVPAFLASLLGAAFIQSWLYNASGSSSLLPMLTHAILNTAGSGYVFTLIARGKLQRFWWIYAAVWLGMGLLTVVATRGRLGLRRIPAL
jgi:membrane protease YdiL (CAAX protease family)